MREDERLLNFKETMQYLGVSRNTIYRFLEEGRLEGYKVGCTWRFYLKDITSFVKRRHAREQVEDRIEQG